MGRQSRHASKRVSICFNLKNNVFNFCLFSSNYWFQLLQILQKYGEIQHFNFVYHPTGTNVGQPKGFAFVKYTNVSFNFSKRSYFKINLINIPLVRNTLVS